jgi:Beta-lactamase
MIKRSIALIFSLLLLNFTTICAQLPKSTPEAEGVSSAAILDFIKAVENSKNEFHSIMILRHGKVITEGWWKPYRSDLRHTMYSVSKSFTATAVGFAVTEKKLSVNDKVISFFPEDLPDTVTDYLKELSVKDLLTMSVGQDPDPTGPVIATQENWVKGFFSVPIKKKPGSVFLYNSLATYMLSAIVQKVTGERMLQYLSPRLFNPLGIKNIDWEIDPKGINSGGWGLRLKTEDMAKFGQLFLQKGKWQGKQIIPASWIEEASTFKIDQKPELSQAEKDKSDWTQGYCYQMWRCKNNAYRGDGAFGQYIIVMPDQDAVIAITSETGDMQDELNLVWKHLLPAMGNKKLPVSANTLALKQKMASLSLKAPLKNPSPGSLPTIAGKTIVLEKNEKNIEQMSFSVVKGSYTLTMKSDTSNYTLSFTSGQWKNGVTSRKGPNLVYRAKGHFKGLPAPLISGAYFWQDNNSLELDLRYIESPHTEKMVFHFEGEEVQIDIQNSFDPSSKTTLKGKIKS